MESINASHIMTLVNSIIGVSILAMPFCYKECGILLATLILIFSNLMTRLSCHYLLKSAIMTRRKSFELLAFHAFGTSGKTAVELSIILLMIGTCIAFFVVMGDLGPAIIGTLLEVEYFTVMRPAVLIGLAVFVVLPLGLLRNVDSLSSICTASFLFYLFLVFKVFVESTNNLFSGFWINEIHYWRPSGILQCLPIFSMALSCQTQLLEIFDSINNGTLDRMNSIVKSAVNLCTALYISVGFFGYIAYYKQSFSGNLLMSFSKSYFSEFIKLGFVLSVAVTFPLVIFPCRASLHSLIFKKVYVPHYELVTGGGNYIPESHFKCITLFIITSSLIVGLLAPNIEIVLSLLGSTIGVIICILCPPCLFIWISNKATTEKILAKVMCALGFSIMIMGTYANLFLSDSITNIEMQSLKSVDSSGIQVAIESQNKPVENIENLNKKNDMKNTLEKINQMGKPIQIEKKISDIEINKLEPNENIIEKDKRVEPPIPVDPVNNKQNEKVEAQGAIISQASKEPVERLIESQVKQLNKFNNQLSQDKNKNVQQHNEKKNDLKKQKEIFKKIKDSNKNKKRDDNSNFKLLEKTIQDIKNKPIIESRKRSVDTPFEKNEKKNKNIISNEKATSDVSKLISEKLPLPILMNASGKTHNKEKVETNVIQKDILDNLPVEEREKRDLYFVKNYTNDTIEHAIFKSLEQAAVAVDKDEITVTTKKEADRGFLKNIAKTTFNNSTCEKQKINEENIDKSEEKMKLSVSDNMSVFNKKSEINDLIHKKYPENKFNKIILTPTNFVDSHEISPNSVNFNKIQKNQTKEEKNKFSLSVELLLRNSQSKETSKIESDGRKESENNSKKHQLKNSIILAPSKLSDPSIILQGKVLQENCIKSAVSDVKPMFRELKTLNDKTHSGNRKK